MGTIQLLSLAAEPGQALGRRVWQVCYKGCLPEGLQPEQVLVLVQDE